jgi:hypothetical protein
MTPSELESYQQRFGHGECFAFALLLARLKPGGHFAVLYRRVTDDVPVHACYYWHEDEQGDVTPYVGPTEKWVDAYGVFDSNAAWEEACRENIPGLGKRFFSMGANAPEITAWAGGKRVARRSSEDAREFAEWVLSLTP